MKAYLSLTFLCAVLVAGCATHTPAPDPAKTSVVKRPSSAASNEPARADARAQHCVALAMYWEARGEGRLGMAAVGAVIANRMESHAFPNDHCGVVHQGGETPPCQFSWWCDGKSDRPRDQRQWLLALETADELLNGRLEDPTDGALFFHSTAIARPWKRMETAKIGNHIFYR